MTFEEAFDKAVKAFYEGKGYDEYESKTGTKVKYNKGYFDSMEPNYRPKPKKEEKEVKNGRD